MTERIRNNASSVAAKTDSDLGPRKTMLVLVIVVGCFAVLWPKVFYPMLLGSASQHIKPSAIDKTTGCCDVISETDVNTIKILSEMCSTIIQPEPDEPPSKSSKELVSRCRKEILDTCGIDIAAVLQEQVRLGQTTKEILNEIRSLNGSLCLKYNFGVAPWKLGVPHRVTVKVASASNIRQERPLHLRSELIHPAFRERGRAIPQAQTAPPAPARPAPRVLEGRPGPVPGMRPTIGGAGHVVPPSKQGTSSMSIIMPIYTIGIVIFFTYTLMKIIFKKQQPESVGGALYPPIEPDSHFRKEVFESDRSRMGPKLSRENISNKLGDVELDQLRHRLRETEKAMERIVDQMSKVPLKAQDLSNGGLSNGSAPKPQEEEAEEQASVKVLGMEMTASCEGGKKWSRPESPVAVPPTVTAASVIAEPLPPPQEIYLEGALPAQSHLLVSESATESSQDAQSEDDPAVVLSGKMTLSVISLDSSENGNEIVQENRNELEEEEEEIVEDLIVKSEASSQELAHQPPASSSSSISFINSEQEEAEEKPKALVKFQIESPDEQESVKVEDLELEVDELIEEALEIAITQAEEAPVEINSNREEDTTLNNNLKTLSFALNDNDQYQSRNEEEEEEDNEVLSDAEVEYEEEEIEIEVDDDEDEEQEEDEIEENQNGSISPQLQNGNINNKTEDLKNTSLTAGTNAEAAQEEEASDDEEVTDDDDNEELEDDEEEIIEIEEVEEEEEEEEVEDVNDIDANDESEEEEELED